MEGAVPGKPLKKKKDADVAQKSKEYESKRERKFNPSWKQGRPWLEYDDDEKIMKCCLCISQYGGGEGSDLNVSCSNLKGQNSFLKGCSNFRHTTISDHEKTRSHIHADSIAKAKCASSSVAYKALLSVNLSVLP